MIGSPPKRLATMARNGRRERHETFMAITSLEMERQRRAREVQLCKAKLATLEARIGEIDEQVAQMLSDVGASVSSTPRTAESPRVPGEVSLRY